VWFVCFKDDEDGQPIKIMTLRCAALLDDRYIHPALYVFRH